MVIETVKKNDDFIDIKFAPYKGKFGKTGEWYIVCNFIPSAECIVVTHDEFKTIEMHSFIVNEEGDRRRGIGTAMMRMIRKNFPDSFIWTDTWDHSRPFWQKMVDVGYVDKIANDYSWPCFDTNCEVCHPHRNSDIRRGFKISKIKEIGGEKHE